MAILDQFDLSGKTAIITGAGSNLGREMALAMAEAGADIVGAGRRPEPLDETGELVRAKGRRFLTRSTDVTDSSDVGALIDAAIAEFGRIDILVNNAGGGSAGRGKTLPEHTDEDWYAGIDANLSSAFFCARAIIPHMVEQGGGRIINITSGWGFRGGRNRFMYPIAKAGMISLTKCLAMSYARDGVRVSCIAPGAFPHELGPETEARGGMQPAGQFGVMEDLGPLSVFLASDASEYLSGETVLIDGGAIAAGVTPAGVVPVVAG
jgi:NAD(P)-dependent dehydrogenase (short-subunit alcohol dehydrogenase family)